MISPISFGSSNMDVYNEHFKNMRRDEKVDFENFNGKRTIELYRGDIYMNKITKKLETKKPWLFIRFMVNKGTKKNPNLKDATYAFTGPGGDVVVYLNELHGIEKKGVTLHIFRHGFIPFKKQYESLAKMRRSRDFRGRLNDVLKPNKILKNMSWI